MPRILKKREEQRDRKTSPVSVLQLQLTHTHTCIQLVNVCRRVSVFALIGNSKKTQQLTKIKKKLKKPNTKTGLQEREWPD